LAQLRETAREARLSGNIVVGEIVRNMELGRFEMTYTVLMPCVFTVYLNPDDYQNLSGVLDFISEDARRALRTRVNELNASPGMFGRGRRAKAAKDHKIACRDWDIEFFPDPEVPAGDVEIHSQLNETVAPGYRGTKTTLIGREPSVTSTRSISAPAPIAGREPVFAELHYQDDSGPQAYFVTQNRVRVGRGGADQPMDLALYTSDEISREHFLIRRDPASGIFFITDCSTNGTWVNGKRIRKGVEDVLPQTAEIALAEVLTLSFEVRR
jgi:hypothetical protein